jgi:hypothetical protein
MQTATYLVFYNYLKKNGEYNDIKVTDIANEVTMLTCDKTVHYRNVLLGLPSILTTNEHEIDENGKKKFKHSTKRGKMFVPSGDIASADKIKHDILKRQIASNNEELIKLLQSLNNDLSLEMIIPPKNKYRAINTQFKEIENLIEEIEKINTLVNGVKDVEGVKDVAGLKYEELYENRDEYLIPHFLFKSRKPYGFVFDPNMIKKLGEKNPKLFEIFTKYLNIVWDKNPDKIHKNFPTKEKFREVFGITDEAGEKEAGEKEGGGSRTVSRYSNLEEYFEGFDSWVEKSENKYFDILNHQVNVNTGFPVALYKPHTLPKSEKDEISIDLTDKDSKEDFRLSVDELMIFYELEQIVKDINTAKKPILSDYDRLIIFMFYKRIVYNYNLSVIKINHERTHQDKKKGAKSNESDNGFLKLIELIMADDIVKDLTENINNLDLDRELEPAEPATLYKEGVVPARAVTVYKEGVVPAPAVTVSNLQKSTRTRRKGTSRRTRTSRLKRKPLSYITPSVTAWKLVPKKFKQGN